MNTKIRVFIILLLLVITGIAAWFLSVRQDSESDIRHIVLISIDTCRADYLSCYGYPQKTTPNIDQFAQESILFENALSPIPVTLPAHSSMLTGTIPPYHGIHNNIGSKLAQSNVTLQEILRSNGFTTGAIVSSFVLDSQFGLNQGFDSYNDRFEEIHENVFGSERRAAETSSFAIDWLEKHKDEKSFLFLHYYDPHLDYDPPEPFNSKFAGNLYAGEIAYTDHCIGKVLAKLKELGLYDSTLIILAGDHGEMLGEHGEKDHTYFIYQAAIKVPLIFKFPGQNEPKRIDQLVGIVDIVPTICSILGLEVSSRFHGKDLRPYLQQERAHNQDRYVYCESLVPTRYNANSLLGIVSNRWKYIQTTRPELYDLVEDPGETNNLIEQQPHRARLLQDRLKQLLEQATTGGNISDSKVDLDEESLERLESLGYLGGTIDTDFKFDQNKEDPKDLIDFHSQHLHMADLIHEERFDQAKALCQKLLLQRPQFYELHARLGKIARKQNDYASAASHLYEAINLQTGEGDYKLHYDLAVVLAELGRFEDAIKHYREAIQLRPDYHDAYSGIGSLLYQQAKLDEAAEYFKKALELKPDYTEALCNLGIVYSHQGKTDQAIDHFEKTLKLDPEMVVAHHKLADALFSQNKLDEAVNHYKKVLELGTAGFEVYHNLGLIRSRQEKFDEAIQYYAKALELNTNRVDTRYKLAMLLLKQGKTDQALKHFELVLSLSSDAANSSNDIGALLAQQGKLDLAITYFNKALAINPQLPQAHENLAKVLLQQNKYDDAITHYEKLLEIDPNQFRVHNDLASIFHKQEKFDKACAHLTKSLQLKQNQPIVLNNLAWIKATYEGEKFYDPNEAVQLAKRTCELTGYKAPLALNTLAVAYAASGDFPAAVETAERALELASLAKQNELVAEVREYLKLFKAGQPYRQLRQSKNATSQ